MTDKLKAYLDSLFANVPNTQEVREAKDELYDSMMERYEDCLRDGMDEQAAYDAVVDSVGDIRELIGELDLGDEPKDGGEKTGGFNLGDFVKNITDYATDLVAGFIHTVPPGEERLVHSLNLPLAGVGSIEVNYVSEAITVHRTDGEELVVHEYMNRADEALFGEAVLSGSTVTVRHGRRAGYFGLRSRVEVLVPAAFEGNLALATTSASISSRDSFSLTTLRAKTVSGDVDFENISAGVVHLSTASGAIRVGRAAGRLDLHTVSGSIKVGEVAGSGNFATTSGGIRVFFSRLDGAVKATSVSGGIRLNFPPGAAFELEAKSVSGGVHSAFGGQLAFEGYSKARGFVGAAPFHLVRASTISGGIHIND